MLKFWRTLGTEKLKTSKRLLRLNEVYYHHSWRIANWDLCYTFTVAGLYLRSSLHICKQFIYLMKNYPGVVMIH